VKNMSLLMALALTAGVTGTAMACAAQDVTPTRVAVTFPNADLANPARASDIHSRMLKAAQFVCESEGEGPKWREADDRACETEAMQKAEQQLKAAQKPSQARNDRVAVRFASR